MLTRDGRSGPGVNTPNIEISREKPSNELCSLRWQRFRSAQRSSSDSLIGMRAGNGSSDHVWWTNI